MNKIIIFISTVFFGSYQLIGQSSILLTQHTPSTATTPTANITIVNGGVIYRTVAANNCDAPACVGVELNVKNISSSTKTYNTTIRKLTKIINTCEKHIFEKSFKISSICPHFTGGLKITVNQLFAKF